MFIDQDSNISDGDLSKKLSLLLLQSENVYSRAVSLKERLEVERASIEEGLRSSFHKYICNIQNSINSINNSKRELGICEEKLLNIKDLHKKTENLIENYGYVKQISVIRENILCTMDTYERFEQLNNEFERVSHLLDIDLANDKKDPAKNLLLIHYYLCKIEDFKLIALYRIEQKSSKYVIDVSKRHFSRFDELYSKFSIYFWNLCERVMEFTKESKSNIVIWIIRVIEKEESLDHRTLKIQEALTSDKKIMKKVVELISENVMKANREIRLYKKRFLRILSNQIESKFAYVDEKESGIEILSHINFYFEDLLTVKNNLVSCFPSNYNIMEFFVMNYHRHIYTTISNKILHNSIGAGEILSLFQWIKKYQNNINDSFGIPQDALEPELIGNKGPALIKRYVDLSRDIISKWFSNFLKMESQSFIEREGDLEKDYDGKLTSISAKVLFQMMDSIIEPVYMVSKGKFLVDIIRELSQFITNFHIGLGKVIESESKKLINDSNDSTSSFERYVIMAGNNCFKGIEYVENLKDRLKNDIDNTYKSDFTDITRKMSDGFLEMARLCNGILSNIILSSVKPAINKLFTKEWYKNNIVGVITVTLDDYFDDFSVILSEYLCQKLLNDVFESLLVCYLSMMKHHNAVYRIKETKGLLSRDYEFMYNFLKKHKDEKKAKAILNSLESVFPLLSPASRNTLFMDVYDLWNKYPDISSEYIEDILLKRDDFDKVVVKDIMDSCKSKRKNEEIKHTSSIFSKIKKA